MSGRTENDLFEELQFHLEKEIEKNIAAGMNPEEARNAALRSFGGVEQVKERCPVASNGTRGSHLRFMNLPGQPPRLDAGPRRGGTTCGKRVAFTNHLAA